MVHAHFRYAARGFACRCGTAVRKWFMAYSPLHPDSVIDSREALSRLQRRIRLFEFIGIVLTAVLVGVATLIPMHGQLRRNLDMAAGHQVQNQARAAGQLLASFASIAAQLTSRSQIRDALAHYNEGRISRSELEAFSIPRLQDALEQSPQVIGLLRLDREGLPAVAIGKTIPETFWRIPATGLRPQEVHGPFRLLGNDVVIVSTAIVTREGVRVGTDVVAFDLSSLRDSLAAWNATPFAYGAQVYLYHPADRRLVRLAASGGGFVAAGDDDPVHAALRGMRDPPQDVTPVPGSGGRLMFVAAMAKSAEWQLVVTMEPAVLYAGASRELYWPIAAIILLMVASGALMLAAVRPLSHRIAQQSQRLVLAASVFSTSGEGIVILDADRRIIELNPAGCRMLGLSAAELRGSRFCGLAIGQPDDPECREIWRQADERGQWQGELPLKRADGTSFDAWLSLACVRGEDDRVTNYSGLFVDISARKEAESQIRSLAYHDELTGLPNRILMQDRLGHALRQAPRARARVALLFLDLDRFKPVNDSFGHAVGDRLLQAVAERLKLTVREGDTLARVHGDEFVVILEGIDTPEPAARVAAKIVAALGSPFTIDGREILVGTSVGIAIFPDHATDPETLLRCADIAMYDAKQAGRNGYRFFTEGEQASDRVSA